MCLNARSFRTRFTNADLGPILDSLRVKREEAEYHVRRLMETRSDPIALFHGQNEIGEPQRFAGINGEINAAMHVLRTMLDILARVVNLEKGLGLGAVFHFHHVKDHPLLAGSATRQRMDDLNTNSQYLRDFDNHTKHERVIKTGARECYEAGSATYKYPVEAFMKDSRQHPGQDDAVGLVCRTCTDVIDGIAEVLTSL